MDIEVTNSPELSVGEPQSVPSRISVVLVEEAKAGGTPRLGCPRVDQDIRLLAGVVKPASVTVCEDSHGSLCVGGTLSSSDLAGRLLPVVPAGIPFPVGPVDPAGPDGPYVAGGPVGPYGILSPSDSEPAGSLGPYVAGGPVGPDGTLSPFISDPAGPDGLYVADGPVGPYGTLSPSDSGSCPSVPTDDLASVAAVPLPAMRDPMVAQSRCETIDGMTVYYGSDLSDESDWDDPYDIVGEEYVDQYNFDVPEGMDLMVFERGKGPSGSEMLDDEGTGLALVCQTSLCDPQGKLDTVDIGERLQWNTFGDCRCWFSNYPEWRRTL